LTEDRVPKTFNQSNKKRAKAGISGNEEAGEGMVKGDQNPMGYVRPIENSSLRLKTPSAW
jgi:hypothetical protein